MVTLFFFNVYISDKLYLVAFFLDWLLLIRNFFFFFDFIIFYKRKKIQIKNSFIHVVPRDIIIKMIITLLFWHSFKVQGVQQRTNARFHFDWFLNKIIFYTGSLKSLNLTYFFSCVCVCVFECMIAEIHNSYVFNTFNEYQKEVFPIENTIVVVCITRSIVYVLYTYISM